MKFAAYHFFLALVLLLIGCGDSPKNYTVDVNAYSCTACSTKFYLTNGDHAQRCPQCKNTSIEEVATYVCPADQQKTVAPRSREGARCSQCKTIIAVSQYPSEEDLKTWGATEKSKAEAN